jgi:hypothetical protein
VPGESSLQRYDRRLALCPPKTAQSTRPARKRPVLHRNRLGGLIREYSQVAYRDRVFGIHGQS